MKSVNLRLNMRLNGRVHSNAFVCLSEYLVNLITVIPILKRPSIFMNVPMWEHHTFDRFLHVAKFTTLTQLSLLILCKLSFPVVDLNISSPHFIEI
jgi:hypothetical protein